MPQLLIRGAKIGDVASISKAMVDELQLIVGCPREYFTIEIVNTTFIADGKEAVGYPIVQVNWFARGQEIQDKVAKTIDAYLHNAGYEQVDIFFVNLSENCYYDNGQHF